ncbi:aldolase [Anaerobacillus sp. CMMVII]|uniref:HPr kinase/phosphorylase n=1 Tax=Anaerobacillus sp. CMMVII TaxID=2755588 RepID=UPI0021B731C2|nr:aldolase [Anaerobacillus sp. CMMVII]MCT8138136.1 aldolase [Anaerobacillus sp. CMMVII]
MEEALLITNKLVYRAFGYNVLSDFDLPELPNKYEVKKEEVDITISFSELNGQWKNISKQEDDYFVLRENLIMFCMPGIAIFSIENGDKIYVTPLENSQEDHIRLYLLGTCMGAILMQRKILPLHGSAVAINGKVYAIVGDSGAGKSTLASAFLHRGYRLLSDDVIPVSFNEDNIPIVTPAYPQQKLWKESLDAYGMQSDLYRPIIDRETKFAIPVPEHFEYEVMPLAGIIELTKTESDEIDIKPINDLQRFHTLFYHTYRNFFIEPLGLMEWHFNTSAKMLNKLEMYQIKRPISRFTAHDLTEVILSTITKEVSVG